MQCIADAKKCRNLKSVFYITLIVSCLLICDDSSNVVSILSALCLSDTLVSNKSVPLTGIHHGISNKIGRFASLSSKFGAKSPSVSQCRLSYPRFGIFSYTGFFGSAECSTTGSQFDFRKYRANLLPDDDEHSLLKELYLARDKYLDESLGRKCYFYRYFNITKSNIEDHLNSTMSEFFARKNAKEHRSVYVIDGNAFNGDYSNWKLPLPRNMSSYVFDGLNPDALNSIETSKIEVKPQFGHELLNSIYELISQRDADKDVSNSTDEFINLYDEVGDYDYAETEDGVSFRKDYLQDVEFISNEHERRERKFLHNVLTHPTTFPSYLDPDNPALRTGRRRELQRKADSGRLQKLRWKMDVDYKDDILRGNWTMGDNVTKEFLDSIEWEQPLPTYHDQNYFRRSFSEAGYGDEDRTVDSYFDVQFIGSTDAYPYTVSAGMQYAWPIYWVPLLCKRHPRRRAQPIRSPMFNLGGIEPLQLWFYPEGSANSRDGYCALKIVSPPGWCLPYRIYMFICSEYNRVVFGPMYRESPTYVCASLNFCRLMDKSDKQLLNDPQNDNDYVILGPSGNIYVGVGIVDEGIRKKDREYRFKYDWDEGDYDFNQWLKKQTADPDDEFTEENIAKEHTHSVWYESHKYKYVPDRHVSRYWKAKYKNETDRKSSDF